MTASGGIFLPCGHTRGALAARGVALLAGAIAALGGPVAQLLWIEELPSADKRAAPQYRIVLATACDQTPRANSQELRAKSQEPRAKSKEPPPRLLKPLADHWEAASRVHIDGSDIPAPAVQTEAPECGDVAAHERPILLYLTYDPPSPPARGPPATV